MARKNLDFEGALAEGENTKGFVAQTPTGTRTIPNGPLKIWQNGPDYPPLSSKDPKAWGRMPLKNPESDELK